MPYLNLLLGVTFILGGIYLLRKDVRNFKARFKHPESSKTAVFLGEIIDGPIILSIIITFVGFGFLYTWVVG